MNLFYVIIAVLAIICVILLCKAYKELRVPILTLICLVAMGGAVFSGIEINKYYNSQGGIFGVISGYFNTNEVEVNDMEFSFKNLEMVQVHDDVYSAIIYRDEVFKLTPDTNYNIFVNGVECSNTEGNRNYITAEYRYNFYDDNLDLLLSDTLYFRFAFNENYTYISVETQGGTAAVNCWNSYFNKNNFVVEIKPTESVPDHELEYTEGEVPEICFLTMDVDGETSKVLIPKNTQIGSLLYVPTKEFYHFKGWSLDGSSILNSSYTITEDATLIAVFELHPGLYENGVLKTSWDELVSDGVIEVNGTEITSALMGGWQHADNLVGFLVIDDSIQSISASAFSNCYNLTGVILPDGIKRLNEEVFYNCYNLTEVKLPANLTSIGDEVFQMCSGLESIEIPETVTSIGNYAFSGSGLQSVELPETLTIIGNYAFSSTELNSIEIPETVTTIGEGAFASTYLTSVVLPYGIKTISSFIFSNCENLQEVYIPETVTNIQYQAFANCVSLKHLYLPSSVGVIYTTPTGEDNYPGEPSFSIVLGCTNELVIYCGAESKPEYFQDYWNAISDYETATVKFGYTYEEYLAEINQ